MVTWASRLLEHLRDALGEMSVTMIYLITHRGTLAENFYRKNGYQVNEEDVMTICEW